MDPNSLVEQARRARKNAYAPYSSYPVGAALLCADGSIYIGCNVENSAYGLTNCAERTALFSAVADGKTRFSAIAIAASEKGPVPFPCGACRQVLSEFCEEDFTVYVASEHSFESITLDKLLPHRFNMGISDD